MTTTFVRLRAILVKDYQLDPHVVTPEASFETLGIDSLGTAELLFNVEDAFKVTMASQPVQLTTVGDVVRFIDELIAMQESDNNHENAVPVPADHSK